MSRGGCTVYNAYTSKMINKTQQSTNTELHEFRWLKIRQLCTACRISQSTVVQFNVYVELFCWHQGIVASRQLRRTWASHMQMREAYAKRHTGRRRWSIKCACTKYHSDRARSSHCATLTQPVYTCHQRLRFCPPSPSPCRSAIPTVVCVKGDSDCVRKLSTSALGIFFCATPRTASWCKSTWMLATASVKAVSRKFSWQVSSAISRCKRNRLCRSSC